MSVPCCMLLTLMEHWRWRALDAMMPFCALPSCQRFIGQVSGAICEGFSSLGSILVPCLSEVNLSLSHELLLAGRVFWKLLRDQIGVHLCYLRLVSQQPWDFIRFLLVCFCHRKAFDCIEQNNDTQSQRKSHKWSARSIHIKYMEHVTIEKVMLSSKSCS